MEDKDLMEKELLLAKGICELYLHASLEATTLEVHNAFKEALNESLDIQNKIFTLMSEKGWYQMQNVQQQEIDTLKQKFSTNN